MKILYNTGTVLMLCFLLSASAMAQQITGLVLDAAGKPLAGVRIAVKRTMIITLSGPDGRFSLAAGRGDTLALSKAAYLTKDVAIHNGTFFQLTLRPEFEQIAEVQIVSNGYQSLPVQKATGSFEQIDKKAINRSVGSGVLARLEGVSSILFDKPVQ
jgi:hypothetical protein